jgi:hypothetical protein
LLYAKAFDLPLLSDGMDRFLSLEPEFQTIAFPPGSRRR